MGVLVPLFKPKARIEDIPLDHEQRLRVKLIHNSIEALKREEKAVEKAISDKCRDEIDRLEAIDRKMRSLVEELDSLCGNTPARTNSPKR